MSGISGIYHPGGRPVTAERIAVMTQRLEHRGPDRRDVWCGEAVGLGHVLLRTTPEDLHEVQPLKSRNGQVVLTADARIDNREELIGLLGLENSDKAVLPDSAIIVAAYQRWGMATPEKLAGDFAFAIWDAEQRLLFCARDAVGIKPFYYHRSDTLFAFASEVGALLALNDIPRDLNERQILAFITDLDKDRSQTFYTSIRRLPPGHAMTVDPTGRSESWRYWKPEVTVQELRYPDDRAYEEGFRDVFDAAMRSSLRSSTPVGIQLSGGLDSSAVACTARVLLPASQENPIHTFTGIFPSLPVETRTELDETKYVDDILAQGGFEPRYVRADEISPLDGLEQLIETRGEPFKLRSHYYIRRILEQAQEQGIRVMLDGSEGDIVVGYGYDYFGLLAESGDWRAFADMARTHSENCRLGQRSYPPERAFWSYGVKPLLSHVWSGQWVRFLRESGEVSEFLGIEPTALLRSIVHELPPEIAKKQWRRLRYGKRSEIIAPEVLRRAGLPGKEDREAPQTFIEGHARAIECNAIVTEALEGIDPLFAHHQIEARHPFFDRRVVEFCLGLPAEQRLKGGWTRSIVRRALHDVLPESVQKRVGKAILGMNTNHKLLELERENLKRYVRDAALRPYVKQADSEQAYDRFVQQPTSSNTTILLRLAVLVTWLHRQTRAGSEANREEMRQNYYHV